LTISGQSEVQKYNLHDNRYLPTGRRWSINSGEEWSESLVFAFKEEISIYFDINPPDVAYFSKL